MTRRSTTALTAILTLSAAWLFLFADHAVVPLVLWDESRVAVNALEMHLREWSLVATYDFVPDLWNTKPPLAVWLIVASFKAFGVSEFTLRLPSMIGAVATLALVFAFTRRITRSDSMAALAAALTALSISFFGPNGVKTAEYDALLCAFTTGYLIVLFAAVHRPRPDHRLLILFALLVAAATMTKGIAGLVPGAGAFVYLLLTRRIGRVLRDPRYVLAGLVALVPVAAFLVAREAAASGYLAAAFYNDVAGRFGDALDGHSGSPLYYAQLLFGSSLFVVGPPAVLVPAAVLIARGRQRAALIFALCCIVAPLTILSFAATKLAHYAIPVVPWLAIATAIAVDVVRRRLAGRRYAGRLPARSVFLFIVGLALVPGVVLSARFRYDDLPRYQFYPRAGYGVLLADLRARGVREVTLVEPGIEAGGFTHYAPQLHYYAVLARARGMRVARLKTNADVVGPVGTCDKQFTNVMLTKGATAARYPGCVFLLRPVAPAQAGVQGRNIAARRGPLPAQG